MLKSKMFKKLISMVMSAAVVLSALIVPTVTASAASATVQMDDTGVYVKPVRIEGPTSGHDAGGGNMPLIKIGSTPAYCFEPGVELYSGDILKDNNKHSSLSTAQWRAIGFALYFGYPNNADKLLVGTVGEKYAATQAIVWEISCGYRSATTFKVTDKRIYNALSNTNVKKNYNAISNAMVTYETIPSFMGETPRLAKTVNLKYNSGTKRYEATLTDTKNVLSKYSFSASGCTIAKSGNKLKIVSSTPNKTVTVKAEKNPKNVTNGAVMAWNASGKQSVVAGSKKPDPVYGYINFKTPDVGNLVVDKTIKSSVSGGKNGVKTSNFSFNLSGTASDGTKVNLNATTNANGRATFSNVPVGTYTLKENAVNPSNGTDKAKTFIMPKPIKVTISANKTTNLTGKNAMPNEMVEVRIVKRFTDKDGKLLKDVPLNGYQFKLSGTTLYNEKVERTGTTDKNGKVTFANLWKGTYTITEVNSGKAQNCVLPKAKTVTWVAKDNSKYKEVSLDNTPKYGNVDLQKLIKTAGGANVPNQDLSGFAFNLSGTSDLGIKVNVTKTTDKLGKANFADIPVGNYTLKEIVNDKSMQFKIGLPINLRVNYNQTTKVTRNNYIPTDVTIYKVDADTHKVITDGVTKLKVCKVTDNGYEDIGVYETVDGMVEIDNKVLENGKYAIIELEAPSGYVLSDEPTYFEIADGVDTNGRNKKAPTVFVDNAPTKVDLYKTNNEGEPLEGATFEIKNAEETVIATETTDSEGKITLSGLTEGKYTYQETNAPEGYVKSNEIYSFEIDKDGKLTNTSQTTVKDDEISLKVYKKNYKGEYLEGAEFTMYALEDGNRIKDDNGNDKPYAVAVTDENGMVEFKKMPIGDYEIVETKAPEGYFINEEVITVSVAENWDNELEQAKIEVTDEAIPEIGTTATIDGAKTANPAEILTIDDVVAYKNLIIGKEYTLKGVLMDKATAEPFKVDGKEVTSEVTFTAEQSDGEITVSFAFDGSGITTETNIVVFESLYRDSIELATHADIEDEGQTVKVTVPEIHTTATIDGAKEAHPNETLTIDDIVAYKNLIIGKEYTLKGVLMDKATGEPFEVNGEQITSEVTFTAEKTDGEVTVSFAFDGSKITTETNLVVFESLYRDSIELATHADIEDEGQTVKIEVPEEIEPEPTPEEAEPTPTPEEVVPEPTPEEIVPKTGDDIALPVALAAISLMALAVAIVAGRKKNEQ